ncbi:chelonianin-like [Penaeus japonicus]|uniref:chelonianin-like n=1 Tax=Penaeus japonicus TaxID=27405 RepID=UPI001C7170C8|nr:chelonianin-like [Penaeus japonicus]
MINLRLAVMMAMCLALGTSHRLSCKYYCPGPYADQYACCDPSTRPGSCPSPPRCTDFFDGNVPTCYIDSDCSRGEKCCEDACNAGKICISVYGLGH